MKKKTNLHTSTGDMLNMCSAIAALLSSERFCSPNSLGKLVNLSSVRRNEQYIGIFKEKHQTACRKYLAVLMLYFWPLLIILLQNISCYDWTNLEKQTLQTHRDFIRHASSRVSPSHPIQKHEVTTTIHKMVAETLVHPWTTSTASLEK